MLLYTLLTISLLLNPTHAVCCSNSGAWWCITGTTCTPNCDDGHSYCDPSVETCLNDSWGGCVGIVTLTSAFVEYTNLIESTSYTDTVTSYDPIVTNIVSVTSESDDTATVMSTDEQTQTDTTTIPGTTVTVTDEAALARLFRRADTSTTTLYTTYTTDCAVTEDPSCTTWVEGASTLYLPSTTEITTTVVNDVTNVVTMVSTIFTTITETVTGDDVTVTEQGETTSTTSETSETSTASETEIQGTTTTTTANAGQTSSTSAQTGSDVSATSGTSLGPASTGGAEPRATLGVVPALMGALLVL